MLSLLFSAALSVTGTPGWSDGLDWHGVHVNMQRDAAGAYTLHGRLANL